VKKLNTRSQLKKIPFIVLIITVIAFFAIPSFIFAEGEGTAAIETTQTAVMQDISTGTNTDINGTTVVPAVTEQPATEDETTTSGQTSETDVTDTTGTVTTEAPASETLVNTETQNNENADVVNTEVVYSPLISTDKADYNPGETVTVFGTGFKPDDEIELTFYNAAGEVEFAGLVITNQDGNFIYAYAILGSAEYKVTASSAASGFNAEATFKDRATAEFEGSGPMLAGSQFYEEVMYVDVHRNLTPTGTDDNMIAFCIDLQHYLNDYTGDDFDVYGFEEYNTNNGIPAGKNDSSLTWPLPASIQALANSFDSSWFLSDAGAVSDLDGDLFYTANEKAAAMQEAFWHLVSAANTTDGNTFNYTVSGIVKIRPLVASILSRVDNIAGSVTINPTTDINYLKDNGAAELDFNSHPLTINVNNYSGLGITGATVYLSVTSGQGYFLSGGAKVTQTSITTGAGGIGNISLYADKNTFSGISSLDLIRAYIDVNGDGIETVSPFLTSGGSILYPKVATFPTSRPSGSNQLLILTNLFEPTATASKEWRIPGEITVHKSDGVDSMSLAGAIISLLDGSGNQVNDAWGKAIDPQTTGANGDIPGFKGLAWGDYQVKENAAPAGYNLAANIPVTIPVKISGNSTSSVTENIIKPVYSIKAEVKMVDTRIPGQFRLTKTNSVTGLPVAGAAYNIYDSSGKLIEIITTGPDGSVAVTLQNWGTYTVKESAAPTGYNLDPASYSVTFNAANTDVTLNVSDSPIVTGGGTPTITVAGLTEGVQVLAFTGQDPIISIAGLAAVMAGLAMVVVTLLKRQTLKWKHVKS
jgi:uncharacterized surface anchored protein